MNRAAGDVITDFAILTELAPQWEDLWRRCPAALPFQAPAWLLPWWQSFSPGKLFTIAARLDGRLVGLAPGYIEDGALGRRILPLGISLSDHLDILVDPDHALLAMTTLVEAARSRSDAWDVWELEELLPGAAALRLSPPAGWHDTVQPQSACPVLCLSADRQGAAPWPRGKQRQLNLARNRAARRGTVRIVKADAIASVSALEHLFRLHRLRWESRGGPGVLAPEPVQHFQVEAVPKLQAAGLVRIYVLEIGGAVVAAHYELVHAGRCLVYLTGFDPDYEYESPGVILLAHAIEQARDEGCQEIDFLRGQEPYKYEWGAVDRWNMKRSIRHSA